MSIKWSGQLENRRLELVKDNFTYKQVADILSTEFQMNINEKSVQNRCWITSTGKSSFKNDGISSLALTNEKENNLFPKELYNVDLEVCMTPEKIKELNEIYAKLTSLNPKKILSLSDLHSPFINFGAVEKAVMDNLDADICLLNGDVYDGQAMSSFDKMKEIDLDVELKQIFALLDVLTKKFKYVVWVGGNHDFRRFVSFVMRNFASGMKNYVLQRLNPMDYIAEKYDNLIIIPHDWVQIGDVIFAHLQNFSATDMKTVVNNYEIFNAMRDLLPNSNYKAIVIGHTHHGGKIMKNGTLLIEQGCLCHLQDYKFHKPSKNKWQTAYAVIEFNDMNIDINKTNVIYLD